MSKTPLYKVWSSMRERCYNPKIKSYAVYGGKGISVCKEWDKSFQVFYDWAIKNGYVRGLYIDRINGNKNYCPKNCRWVDTDISGQNRYNVIMTPEKVISIRSEKSTAKKLAEKFGCGVSTINDIRQRLTWKNID